MGNLTDKWNNFKSHKFVRIVQVISSSAIFGLLISLVLFGIEMFRNMQDSVEMTENLLKIQNSLSTRYLGIFPNYLSGINELFRDAEAEDSIIIFEDVLYYGIKSKPDEFKSYNQYLLELRNKGSHVVVAYYNPRSMVFRKMIQEGRFSDYLSDFQHEKKAKLDSLNKIPREQRTFADFMRLDSTLSEKYISMARDNNREKFKSEVENYLKPLHNENDKRVKRSEESVYQLCCNLDAIKQKYLDKAIDEITFADYMQMYREFDEAILQLYNEYGFECVALDEYLTMSCWMAGDKMIFAFPSKYATDEIGFYSQDPAFSKYVRTMLNGVKR